MEQNGAISPDGQWLAYESNDLGPQTHIAVFVRPFPEVTKEKYLVSTDGGTQPLWARNGRELFYLAPNGALMSVRVEPGARWTTGTPARLIDGRYLRGAGNSYPQTYRRVAGRQAVSDGQGSRRPQPAARAGQDRRRPELVRGTEAPRAAHTLTTTRDV